MLNLFLVGSVDFIFFLAFVICIYTGVRKIQTLPSFIRHSFSFICTIGLLKIIVLLFLTFHKEPFLMDYFLLNCFKILSFFFFFFGSIVGGWYIFNFFFFFDKRWYIFNLDLLSLACFAFCIMFFEILSFFFFFLWSCVVRCYLH